MDRARFGMFDFSPSTGELRRNGIKVRLQAQPARVLAALVTRPGQIVTRDTLQREIWSDGTHVDFERGLNFCIAQVRSALGDSAEAPHYVETVPKQGYRFIANVADGGSNGLREPTTFLAPPGTVWNRLEPARTFLILAILVGLGLLVWSFSSRGGTAVPTVAVIPFYNETGRQELDPLAKAIGDSAVARLAAPERTAFLSVIGNASSLRNPFARQDVQQIARELGAEWVLIGQLKTDGNGLRVIAHLIRVADMKHLWAHTFDDGRFSLEAQTRAAEAIGTAVTGSLSPTQ